MDESFYQDARLHWRDGHDTLLTMKEVLGYLRVGSRTVHRLIKAGEIPALRVGRLWRFRKSDIDAWLESHQPVTAAAEPRVQAPAGSVTPPLPHLVLACSLSMITPLSATYSRGCSPWQSTRWTWPPMDHQQSSRCDGYATTC